MKILRIVLGLIVAAWTLSSLLPWGMTVAYRAGLIAGVPGDAQRMLPWMDAVPWWNLALWGLWEVLFAIAAWRLFRGGKAFLFYLAGYVVDVVQWWLMQGSEAYKRSFTPQELVLDYYILGGLAVIGALIWFTERRRTT